MAGRTTTILLILLAACALPSSYGQKKKVKQVMEIPENFCIQKVEYQLYQMINDYRHQYDLPPIPLSKSLSFVARTHVKDLFINHPDVSPCNSHSWSDNGPWTPFCYPRDKDEDHSVWDKPTEIAGYPSQGFEIVYWENNAVVIDSVISFWRSIDYFNSFLMNTGKWEGKNWEAIGIGILENYACAWFGTVEDPEGAPWICGQKPAEPKFDSTANSQITQNIPLTAQPVRGRYYIIVKSQIPLQSAKQEAQKLRKKGYAKSVVLNYDKKIRVSLYDGTDREVAISKLREARKLYHDAWLYKH
jgi:hypothetical protein